MFSDLGKPGRTLKQKPISQSVALHLNCQSFYRCLCLFLTVQPRISCSKFLLFWRCVIAVVSTELTSREFQAIAHTTVTLGRWENPEKGPEMQLWKLFADMPCMYCKIASPSICIVSLFSARASVPHTHGHTCVCSHAHKHSSREAVVNTSVRVRAHCYIAAVFLPAAWRKHSRTTFQPLLFFVGNKNKYIFSWVAYGSDSCLCFIGTRYRLHLLSIFWQVWS